jgi:hypothetical protein
MKNKSQHHINSKLEEPVFILGGLITLVLLLLKYLHVLNLDLETAASPFIAATLLAHGDKVLFYIFSVVKYFFPKIVDQEKDSSKSQQL